MVRGGIQNKYGFHMQVSARPIGSSFDDERRSSIMSGKTAFDAPSQRVTASSSEPLGQGQLTHRRRFDVRFTNA
jgi:hypothetical protein